MEQGRNGGPRPTDRDPLDLHQAFLDWKVFRSEARSVTLRFGRQELGFGSGRLIAPAEGLNLRRSMDGVRITFQSGKWVWNASALRLVENRAGILDNVPDHNQSFWGLDSPCPARPGKARILPSTIWALTAATPLSKREGDGPSGTLPARTLGRPRAPGTTITKPCCSGDRFLGGPIRAWALSADTGYTVRGVRFAPRLGFRADAASGDPGPDLSRVRLLRPAPAGDSGLLGPSGILGPTNLIDATESLRLRLSKDWMLTLESSTFWRENPNDGVYSPFITPLRIGTPNQPRYVATAPSGTISWQATRHVFASVVYTRFLTGDFFQSAPPSRNIHYLAAWIACCF